MNDSTGNETDLPKGLEDTIAAFNAGCDAKNKDVAPDVRGRIIERFEQSYRENQGQWDEVKMQVLTVARLAGRLAALYANLDQSFKVQWVHARFGLRDAKAECQSREGAIGRHCQRVDLDTP